MSRSVNEDLDDLRKSAAEAFGLARTVRDQLIGTVVPALPPARRTFAEWLGRKLENGAFFEESMVRDIDAFIAEIERLFAAGTHIGWEADAHHVRGGYPVVYLDDRARALEPVVDDLRLLRTAIVRVLDTARAASIAGSLAD
ncbi:hypothetical protein [Pararhodobacter sp. SW119]|uniref:hypothetical protein n=1 Tax=Pararhodobacter sp. SW119 TaxID=2780075 RepID=UPI001ADFC8D2|nr:hypothetical protein [Pararhodobacter sp. SW119]